MPAAHLPENEFQRLAELRDQAILDTPAEPAFDRLTRLAATAFRVPTSLVSLVDRERQWFKSRIGFEACEGPRSESFCAHAILEPSRVLQVPDATRDPRFSDNPLVLRDPRIRFYAGAPIVTDTGAALGTLCIIDSVPRPALTEGEVRMLADLAECVRSELLLRRVMLETELALSTARSAEAMVRDHSRTLAHDVRSPLTVIMGLAELCQQGLLDPKRRSEYAGQVMTAGQHVLDLVTETLEAAGQMVEPAKFRATTGSTDLSVVLAQLADMCQASAARRRMEVRVDVPPGLATSAPPIRVRQIVLNYLSNALKYAGKDATVTLRAGPQEDGRIRLEVADDGAGMPEEAARRMFERGFRDSATAGSEEGFGHGLAIVKAACGMLGGGVGVTSAPGKGATFWATLPPVEPIAPRGAAD